MKHIIRLTESDLYKIIESSVRRIIQDGNERINRYKMGMG